MHVWPYLSKKTKGIQVSLSETLEGCVELKQNTYVYGRSKGHNSGMTKCINLELSGNDSDKSAGRKFSREGA